MRLFSGLFAIIVLSGLLATLATAKPEYSKKEGKKCVFCHVKLGSKELNDTGKYYKDHNHSLEGYEATEKK